MVSVIGILEEEVVGVECGNHDTNMFHEVAEVFTLSSTSNITGVMLSMVMAMARGQVCSMWLRWMESTRKSSSPTRTTTALETT
jgi:hypothetical protein